LSDELRNQGKDFADFLQNLPEDVREETNRKQFLSAQEEHARFKAAYDNGECYLCHKSLKSFSRKNPCIHWLLKPKGFKKKDIKTIADVFGLTQIEPLLRWYANEIAFAKNINNFSDEGTGNKIIELTIKYNNLEWSFSCAESDYLGHQNSQHAKHPHYHFQMRIDKRPFINFNDFHLPLSKMDIINMEALRTKPDLIKRQNSFGEGMSEVLHEDVIEQALNTAASSEEHNEAPFHIESFAHAKEGAQIQGEDLYQIIQEAKQKGVTVASLLHKLPNAETQVVISPGPGVVEQAPRSQRGKKNDE